MFNQIKNSIKSTYASITSDTPMSNNTAVAFMVAIGITLSALTFNSISIVSTMAEAAAIAALGGTATTSIITAIILSAIPLAITLATAYMFLTQD